MMSDIKERLRQLESKLMHGDAVWLSEAADHIATLEQENAALRVSVEAAVLHAQKGWARSNTSAQSTDQKNMSINDRNIDIFGEKT